MKNSCNEFEEHIVHFLNGELEEEKMEPLISHLEGCGHCRRLESEYRFLMESASHSPLEEPSRETGEAIRNVINERFGAKRRHESAEEGARAQPNARVPHLLLHPIPLYQVVLLVVVLLAGALIWKGWGSPQPKQEALSSATGKAPGSHEAEHSLRKEAASLWSWRIGTLADLREKEGEEEKSPWRWADRELIQNWQK